MTEEILRQQEEAAITVRAEEAKAAAEEVAPALDAPDWSTEQQQSSSGFVLRTLSETARADVAAARGRLNENYDAAVARLTEQFETEKRRLTEQRDTFDANLGAAVDDIIAFEVDAVKAMDAFLEAAKAASVKSFELIPPTPPPAQQFIQGRPPFKQLERPVGALEQDIARTAASLRRTVPRDVTPGNGLVCALVAITIAAVIGAAFIASWMGR